MVLGGALGPGFGAGALRHFTVVSRGKRGTYGSGWRPWAGIWRRGAASLCVAGVAQPDIHLRFTWQASHKLTSTVILRGRRGTYGTGWRPWAGIWRRGAASLCVGRDTTWHPPPFHVAGVAQTHIYRRFAWQAWHLWYWVAPLGRDLAPGRRATLPSFRVAGVALMVLGGALGPGFGAGAPRHFAWQAWHNLTSTFVSLGRRGTISHLPLFCVAGVALMVLGGALGPGFGTGAPRHFAWQAWHNLTSTSVSRGRRGKNSHLPSFCVAGVALMVLGGALGPGFGAGAPRHFTWQAWHNLTSTFVSRGRRGTISHLPSFCVAGVALMVLGGALGPGFGAGAPRHFAWQAWHNLTSTVVLRGTLLRPGTFPLCHHRHQMHTYIHACMHACMHTYIHIHTYTYIHTHTHTYIHTHTYTYIHIHTHTYTYIHIHTHTYTYIHIHTHTYTYIHIHTHTYTYTYIHIHTYNTIHTHTYIPTILHTYIPTILHTYIHTYIPTYIHTYHFTFSIFHHSPPPLSFLPSLSPLKPLKLILGRSWLVGLSGPLIWHCRSNDWSMQIDALLKGTVKQVLLSTYWFPKSSHPFCAWL